MLGLRKYDVVNVSYSLSCIKKYDTLNVGIWINKYEVKNEGMFLWKSKVVMMSSINKYD